MPDSERPSRPLVSIITPTRNQASFIVATLRSVANQSYPNVEHVVIDGASTDGTTEILRRSERPHLTWRSEPDHGMYDALNKGLAVARGDYFGYLNSDDLYFPWTVEAAVAAFDAHPAVDFVYGDAVRLVEETGRRQPWLQAPIHTFWLQEWGSLIQPTVFWRARVPRAIGDFDDGLRFAGDLEYWLRGAAAGFTFLRIDELLAIDRLHGSSASSAHSEQLAHEAMRIRRRVRGRRPSVGPGIARLRAAALRRGVWWRCARAAWGFHAGWPYARAALEPTVGIGTFVRGMLPFVTQRGLESVRWRHDPETVAVEGSS